jgi:hypothetical protein
MDVLNVLTSENHYTTKTLPREVALARPKGQEWEALYDWVVFPPEPRSHAPPDILYLISFPLSHYDDKDSPY